jgi:chromosome segregation ATPase
MSNYERIKFELDVCRNFYPYGTPLPSLDAAVEALDELHGDIKEAGSRVAELEKELLHNKILMSNLQPVLVQATCHMTDLRVQRDSLRDQCESLRILTNHLQECVMGSDEERTGFLKKLREAERALERAQKKAGN